MKEFFQSSSSKIEVEKPKTIPLYPERPSDGIEEKRNCGQAIPHGG